jgi:hypothetical protein
MEVEGSFTKEPALSEVFSLCGLQQNKNSAFKFKEVPKPFEVDYSQFVIDESDVPPLSPKNCAVKDAVKLSPLEKFTHWISSLPCYGR